MDTIENRGARASEGGRSHAQALQWLLAQRGLAHDADSVLCEAQRRFRLGVVQSARIYQEAIDRAGPAAAGESAVYRRLREQAAVAHAAAHAHPDAAKCAPASRPLRLRNTGRVSIGSRRVPRLGLGVMRLVAGSYQGALGHHECLGLPDDEIAGRNLLRMAVTRCGIGYVDFARGYGPWAGAGEGLFRDWMSPYPKDLLWATKVGYERREDGGWGLDLAPESVARDVAASCRQLGAVVPLLYLVVGSTPDVTVLRRRAHLAQSLAPLIEARARGEVENIGVANVTADQLAGLLDVAPIAAVQNKLTLDALWDPPQRAVLDLCGARGIPLVAWGIFQADGEGPWVPGARVCRTASSLGVTPQELAIALLLHAAPHLVILTGPTRRATLDSSLRGANLVLPRAVLEQFGLPLVVGARREEMA